ncbi:Inner membrane protein YohC [Vibrio aerogenes CECT 7868]|uniref:Inner membrane protein YohC n=1 Tax=Vibrio aerogenes CECT 7868 TaxID=1216006 RepID=A0A1M6BTL5_9VIBR|nr:Yip1 family protein [Vibrio aerogenes]SHI52070.1 Inner membrane protein YohC [Vibrio aerogenes CECT 7868]
MINHVWGLLHHPDREWREISVEHETIGHLYLHHVLWMAAIPVICSYIGTTQFGWTFGGETTYIVSWGDGLILGMAFYVLILMAVGGVGGLIHWLARRVPNRPQYGECVIFAGYTATPLFLSGIFALYPVFWLCLLAMIGGIIYTGYLLYRGTPNFLGISNKRGFILSGVTLGAGVLILEFMLAVVVLLWSMGSEHSVVWQFFQS